MSPPIKSGHYVVQLRSLQFRDGTILFPHAVELGRFLLYSSAPKHYLEILKKHHQRSNQSITYEIENNQIVRIEGINSILKKLNLLEYPAGQDLRIPDQRPKQINQAKPHAHRHLTAPSAHSLTDRFEHPASIYYVSLYYNQSTTRIINYLFKKGHPRLSLRSLLTKSQLELVDKEFDMSRLNSGQGAKYKEIIWTEFFEEQPLVPENQYRKQNSIDKEKNLGHPDAENQVQLTRNAFLTIIKEVGCSTLPVIHSYFSDIQAQLICSRMSSSYARSIAEQHGKFPQDNNKELLLYQLHFLANKALQVFGGKILTLIYELPPLRFAKKTAVEVRTYKNVRPDFPMISFTTHQMQVNVAFFTKLHRQQNKLKPHVILFKNKTYETIGSLDELGRIRLQLQSFRPQLSMFIDQINEKKFKIYSGVQTGVCDICKRPLREPLSLRIGIGPVCAKNIGLDRSEYDL